MIGVQSFFLKQTSEAVRKNSTRGVVCEEQLPPICSTHLEKTRRRGNKRLISPRKPAGETPSEVKLTAASAKRAEFYPQSAWSVKPAET